MTDLLHPGSTKPYRANRAAGDAEHLGQHSVSQEGAANELDIFGGELGQPSAAKILGMGHSLKMIGPHTRGDAAKMIELQTNRDWPDELFVSSTMSQRGLTVQTDTAVAVGHRLACADPARSSVASILLLPVIRRKLKVGVQTSHVSTNESDMLSGNMADAFIRHSRDRRGFMTTTLAYPTRIWRRQLSPAPFLTMARKVVVVLALDVAVVGVRLLDLVRGLTTAACAELHWLNTNEGVGRYV